MSIFTTEYEEVPGVGVVAEGGLKFRQTEDYLLAYFAPVLPHVSLADLLGEAVVWALFPLVLALWVFPFTLYYISWLWAPAVGAAVYVVAVVFSGFVYSKAVNYLNLVLRHPVTLVILYGAWSVFFAVRGAWLNVVLCWVWFAIAMTGILPFLLLPILLPIELRLFSLPDSDRALRLVGMRYGMKHGIDPRTWMRSPAG